MAKNRFVMDSLEGVKLIHPDGREESVEDMKISEEQEQEKETDASPARSQKRTKSSKRGKD